MTTSKVDYHVEISGPLLKGTGKPAQDAVEEAVKDLVIEGEREVKLDLRPGHGLDTGHYRNSVHGEITKSMHGIVDDSQVVYGPWLEGVSSRNDRTRFKGYAMFRKAKDKLERMTGDVLKRAADRLRKKLD